jgi:hypothetical protein
MNTSLDRPLVRVSGLTDFRKQAESFNANSERMSLVDDASKIMDLMFITDRRLSPKERVAALREVNRRMTESIERLAALNS